MINENDVAAKFAFKFLLVGNSNVGKTSIVRRFCRDEFEENRPETVSVEFLTSVVKLDNRGAYVKLQIWDTAGQEVYKSVGKSYYRNAIGVILTFSLTDHKSFEEIESWYADVRDLCNPRAVIVLVGNKSDLKDSKEVTNSEAKTFAETHDIDYYETSAKNDTNIDDLFYDMSRKLYDMLIKGEIDISEPLQVGEINTKKKNCC